MRCAGNVAGGHRRKERRQAALCRSNRTLIRRERRTVAKKHQPREENSRFRTETQGKTMKNITVSISDEGYRQARIWAAERNVSLSRIVAYLLETLPDTPRSARRFPRSERPSNSVPAANSAPPPAA